MSLLTAPVKFNVLLPAHGNIGISQVVNAYFFFSLMPYVSPVPIHTDVQLVSGLIAFTALFSLLLKDGLKLDRYERIFLLFCVFFLIYFDWRDGVYQIRKAVGPLYGFGVFYVAKRYHPYFKIEWLYAAVAVYAIAGLVQLVSPEFFSLTFEKFLRVSKYAIDKPRGLTSMAPEPGFLGAVSMYILVFMEWFRRVRKHPFNLTYKVCYALCVVLIILSKSGTGYVLLFLFALYRFWSVFKKYWLLLLCLTVLVIIILSNVSQTFNNYGFSNIVRLASVRNFEMLLSVGTLPHRFACVFVGVCGFITNPLGYGSGSFPLYSVDIFHSFGMDEIFPPHVIPTIVRDIAGGSNSVLGKYLFEYGIFYLLFLGFLVSGLNFKRVDIFTSFLLFTSVLFSVPIVYPPFWITLGIYHKINRKNLAVINKDMNLEKEDRA